MKKTKIIVTGSSGVLGRAIYDKLSENKILDVTGLVFSRNSNKNKVKCDLTNESEVIQCFTEIKPEIIIHSAAERRPDVVSSDPSKAKMLNVSATEYIKNWCESNSAILLYISTDYVFDGSNPPYNEDSQPNPLNEYGKMKLDGEKVVLKNKNNIVLRLPVLYGNVEFIQETAVTVLFDKVKNHSQEARMSNYEKRYPTHCGDVACTISNIILHIMESNSPQTVFGIYQYQSEEEMTKLEMARVMAASFDLPDDHLVAEPLPTGNETTKRPYKSQMTCDKLKKLGLYHPARLFRDGVKQELINFL